MPLPKRTSSLDSGTVQEEKNYNLSMAIQYYSPNKRNIRGPGGVGGLDLEGRAKICAQELASVASRCLSLPPGVSRGLPFLFFCIIFILYLFYIYIIFIYCLYYIYIILYYIYIIFINIYIIFILYYIYIIFL